MHESQKCAHCPYPEIAKRGDEACEAECSWDGTEVQGPGSPSARLVIISQFAQEHRNYKGIEARPAELFLFDRMKELLVEIAALKAENEGLKKLVKTTVEISCARREQITGLVCENAALKAEIKSLLACAKELEALADGTNVSFAALVETIDSKQTRDDVYALVVSARRIAKEAEARVKELEAARNLGSIRGEHIQDGI